MLAHLARQIQARRAAAARGEIIEEDDDDGDGPRMVLPEDCQVQ